MNGSKDFRIALCSFAQALGLADSIQATTMLSQVTSEIPDRPTTETGRRATATGRDRVSRAEPDSMGGTSAIHHSVSCDAHHPMSSQSAARHVVTADPMEQLYKSENSSKQVAFSAATEVNDTPVVAYPTDSKERQKAAEKAAKEAGESKREKKKKKNYVESHFRDCGEDISSLGMSEPLFVEESIDSLPPLCDSDSDSQLASSQESHDSDELTGMSQYAFYGSKCLLECDQFCENVRRVPSIDDLVSMLVNKEQGIDIVELCGSEGRVSQLCVRRHQATGRNFDLVTGADLNDPATQRQVIQYINQNNVSVVVMAPTCTPFGKLGQFNERINHEGWQRSYDQVAPHGRFCGVVAKLQLSKGRHFLCEQPYPSTLFNEEPWREVAAHPNVVLQDRSGIVA